MLVWIRYSTQILSKEICTEVDFTIPPGFGQRKKSRRYAINPEANWGPKKAAPGKNKRKQPCDEGKDEQGAKSVKTIKK